MATVVRMPSVLAGATEAAIANWLVQPGDTVAIGTPIAEIETEKALVEYAAEENGIIGRLVLAIGATAEIGDPIAVLVSPSETDADIDAALGRTSADAPPVAQAVAASAVASASEGTDADATNGHHTVTSGTNARIFASPLVRKIAGQKGVDLAALAGSGPNGRIVRRDLERFLAAQPAYAPGAPTQPAPLSAAPAAPGAVAAAPGAVAAAPGAVAAAPVGAAPVGAAPVAAAPVAAAPVAAAPAAVAAPSVPAAPVAGTRLVPHTPMRRAIARRLTESKATVPHFYLTAECVVDDLLALRRQVNGASPVKVSINDFVIMAAAAAFREVPEANVTWSDEGLLVHENVDISIAVATEGGLVTPVLRGVDRLRLSEVARSAADLAQRARDRRLRQDEIEGGTFAISNLGMYGTLEFAAIINPPQSGILAVGAATPQPVVVDGAVTAATVMRCTLSVDHRAIDGALAARWLAGFTTRLANPLAAII
jgi:pyruvate dehydrogenase E2 component (dihydrolipoamide acetyltransferase)